MVVLRWQTLLLIVSCQPQIGRSLSPNLPPLSQTDPTTTSDGAVVKNRKSGPSTARSDNYHTSDFGARRNHPTSYDSSPPFLGPIRMAGRMDDDNAAAPGCTSDTSRTRSFNTGRERIQHFYQRQNLDLLAPSTTKSLKQSSPTKQKLKAIVEHLAYHNAPVDVKEVCESIEFMLRTRKRLLGAAKQQLLSSQQRHPQHKTGKSTCGSTMTAQNTIHLYDFCCGHGLTGMLFSCCGSGNDKAKMKVILVDQKQPPSHSILLELLTQVCPWIGEQNAITFQEASLDATTTLEGLSSSPILSGDDPETSEDYGTTANLVISTHACGALTDRVLDVAPTNTPLDDTDIQNTAAAIAVMPCCYTGTSQGTPYGIQRALGVAWAADIQRSYHLQAKGYHADFATIPREITPMNRILIGEFKGSSSKPATL